MKALLPLLILLAACTPKNDSALNPGLTPGQKQTVCGLFKFSHSGAALEVNGNTYNLSSPHLAMRKLLELQGQSASTNGCVYTPSGPFEGFNGLEVSVSAISYRPQLFTAAQDIDSQHAFKYCGDLEYGDYGCPAVLFTEDDEALCLDSDIPQMVNLFYHFEPGDRFQGCVYSQSSPKPLYDGQIVYVDAISF